MLNTQEYQKRLAEWEDMKETYVSECKEKGKQKQREPYELVTNFVHLNYATKIHILDTIINHAKDVFGPYGGLYGEMQSQLVGGVQRPSFYRKSKDGHDFFTALNIMNYYGNTVLLGIRQLTQYISGYEGKTSRDGTTSLAMVGCNFAKYALMVAQQCKEKGIQIPSTIYQILFQTITKHGTDLIEEKRHQVYREDTCDYEEGGFDFILNAINTTVDGDSRFVQAYRELMELCRDHKYNIMSSTKSSPNEVAGDPGIHLDVLSGIRLRGSCLNADLAAGFRDQNTVVYFLDGYINAENRDIFVHHLQKWLHALIHSKDAQGNYVFSKETNPEALDAPLLLLTRQQDFLIPVYQDIAMNGVTIRFRDGKKETIIPRIMLAHNDESYQVYFHDASRVFSDSMININGINRWIQTQTRQDHVETSLTKHVPVDQYNLDPFFPLPNFTDGVWTGVEAFTDDPYDPLLGDKNTAVWNMRPRLSIVANVVTNTSYDGHAIYLTPLGQDTKDRSEVVRNEILEQMKFYSDTATEDNKLQDRLDFFNGISIKPTITYRSSDEKAQLLALYQDSLGVFESTHAYGVLAGGNVTIPKYFPQIHDKVIQEVTEFLEHTHVREDRKVQYLECTEKLLDALYYAYLDTYQVLDREANALDHLGDLQEHYADKEHGELYTYNVVTGNMTTHILEAARTTADVFAGACSIAKDMILLERIAVAHISDWNEANFANQEFPVHPRNLHTTHKEEK